MLFAYLFTRTLSASVLSEIAASIALMIAVGSLFWSPERQDYCEAYVYNQHVTDPEKVMQEVYGTMQTIHQNDGANVDHQLHDIFGTD